MTDTNLGEQVARAMARQRQLAAQKAAAGIVLAKYSEAPTVVGWAQGVLHADEIQPYKLLYLIADRGVSC